MRYVRFEVPALRRVRVGERTLLLCIVLLAFALRVFRLGAQAIWWDESLSVYRSTRDLGAILSNVILIQNVVTIDTLPQLYFVFLHFCVHAFGASEFALRFFSVATNVATVPLLYTLARRWFSRQVALVATLLGALSSFYVYYAQEARPYTLVLFWSLLAVYALTRAFASPLFPLPPSPPPDAGVHIRRGGRGLGVGGEVWIIVYLFAAIAALYTHYYAIFLFPFHIVLIAALIWRPRARREYAWIVLPALPLASVVFLIPQVAASMAGNVASGPTFVLPHIILLDLLNSFSVGVTIDFAQVAWIDATMLVLLGIGVAFPRSKFEMQNPTAELRITNYDLRFTILLLAYLAVPIASLLVASLVRPLYQNSRYFIALSPPFYLGVAAGIVALTRRWKILALPALAIFLIGAAASLNNLYFDPRFGRDDHRAWAEYLRERVRPGDFLILDSPHTEELFQYYARDLVPWTSLPTLRADGVAALPDADLATVRDALGRNARVWFLEMHVPFDDPDARIEKLLNQEGMLLDKTNFRGTSTGLALSLFVREFPTTRMSDIAHPLDILFDSRLCLLGYDAPATVEAGTRVVVTLFWQLNELAGEDYGVSLRVIAPEGRGTGTRWGQWDVVPLGNRAGSSTWAKNKVVAAAHDLPVEKGTPSGRYHLQLQVYHGATGNAIGDALILGDIQVVNTQRR
jgi:uncharacterized membrane protein